MAELQALNADGLMSVDSLFWGRSPKSHCLSSQSASASTGLVV